MHRAFTARWLSRALRLSELPASTSVPEFLCPLPKVAALRRKHQFSTSASRKQTDQPSSAVSDAAAKSDTQSAIEITSTAQPEQKERQQSAEHPARPLPLTCHGCGAFSQTRDPNELGYFDIRQRRIKNWLHPAKVVAPSSREDRVVEDALKNMDEQMMKELGLDSMTLTREYQPEPDAKPPLCARCHVIQNAQLSHPTAQIPVQPITVESLRETIEESTHRFNHIYHVLDAADFPMSLIPRLNVLLGDIPLRAKNRRSRAAKYQHDRRITLSFIITKSDLLAPQKAQVDRMIPHLREILREALGTLGARIRLGNVTCVSARRGWWTRPLREAIYKQGGASWLVGKTNVGKSQLFESIYPKGNTGDDGALRAAQAVYDSKYAGGPNSEYAGGPNPTGLPEDQNDDEQRFRHDDGDPLAAEDDMELLPPPQRPQKWPEMPVVSPLPGTTASPIRQIFGKGKGELIDLPGLERSGLSNYVEPQYWNQLVWERRRRPEQMVVKPGQSLILGGGLVRITPADDMNFLMYNFTPMAEHLTSTEKAVEFQEQVKDGTVIKGILKEGAGRDMQHAGNFEIKHDMTKQRAGPLTRANAVGLKVETLPFRVVSLDLLIEGVGYVELAVQMRAKAFEALLTPGIQGSNENLRWPSVDVYTPEGRFIGQRTPINGFLLNKPRVLDKHMKSRPRKSMKGEKARRKLALKTKAQETAHLE